MSADSDHFRQMTDAANLMLIWFKCTESSAVGSARDPGVNLLGCLVIFTHAERTQMVRSAGPFSLCSHIIPISSLWLELSGGWRRSACLDSYLSWGFDRRGLGLPSSPLVLVPGWGPDNPRGRRCRSLLSCLLMIISLHHFF